MRATELLLLSSEIEIGMTSECTTIKLSRRLAALEHKLCRKSSPSVVYCGQLLFDSFSPYSQESSLSVEFFLTLISFFPFVCGTCLEYTLWILRYAKRKGCMYLKAEFGSYLFYCTIDCQKVE